MIYYPISAAINALVSLLLGTHVLLRNRDSPVGRAFLWHLLAIAAWSVPYFLWQISATEEKALFYCRLLMLGAIMVPPLYARFVLLWIGRERQHRTLLRVGFALAAVFLLFTATPLMVAQVEPQLGFRYWPIAGPAYVFFLAFFHGYAGIALWFVLVELRDSTGQRRNLLKYILAANLIGFIGGSTNYFLWYRIPIPPIGNPLVSIYHLIIAYAIARYRLVDMNIVLHRSLTFVLTTAAVTGAAVAILFGFQALMPGPGTALPFPLTPSILLFALAVAAIALGFPPLERVIDRRLRGRAFLRNKGDYETEMLKVIRRVPLMGGDEEQLLGEIGHKIVDLFKVSNAAAYMRSDVQDRCNLVAASGQTADDLPAGLSPNEGVVRHVFRSRHPFTIEETAAIESPRERAAVEVDLVRLGSALVVPIEHEGHPLGVVSLGPKDSGDIFTNADLDLLQTLTQQVALVVWGRRLQQTVHEESKLSALGTLAAGLAHELNNPMVSVRTFLELIREEDIPESYREFSDQVLQDLARIRKLTEGITAFSGLAPGEEQTAVHLDVLLDEVLTFLHHEVKIRRITVERRFMPDLPVVLANVEQLRQVFSNLVLNAVEIMDEGGHLALSTSTSAELNVKGTARRMVRVDVTDTGPGMEQETAEQIFNPFFSTKEMHKGMGLTIVYQAVRANEGELRVESRPGIGTTFSVFLPESASSVSIARTRIPGKTPRRAPTSPPEPPPPPTTPSLASPTPEGGK